MLCGRRMNRYTPSLLALAFLASEAGSSARIHLVVNRLRDPFCVILRIATARSHCRSLDRRAAVGYFCASEGPKWYTLVVR